MKTLFKGKIFDVFEDDRGYQYLNHPGAAAIIAFADADETRIGFDDEKIVFVKQQRPGGAGVLLELPAGKLDIIGEDPEICALRELTEETGYRANSVAKLTAYRPSPGCSNEVIHVYAGLGLKKVADHDATEIDEVLFLTLKESLEKIRTGEITNATTIIALLYWQVFAPGPRGLVFGDMFHSAKRSG